MEKASIVPEILGAIERSKPDGGIGRGHGKAIVFQTDLRAKIEVRAKSGPIPLNQPVTSVFRKGKEFYSGRLLISVFSYPVDSNPVVNFAGRRRAGGNVALVNCQRSSVN